MNERSIRTAHASVSWAPRDEVIQGAYRLLTSLPAPGLCSLWKAAGSCQGGAEVLLKVLPFGLTCRSAVSHQLQLHAQSALAVRHPGALTLLEYHPATPEEPGVLVYEYWEGFSMQDILLTETTPIDLYIVEKWARSLIETLLAAGSHGALHPGQVAISPGDDAALRVGDFRLAQLIEYYLEPDDELIALPEAAEPLNRLQRLCYLSPQRLLSGPVSESDDIFSFGAILYHLLSGEAPRRRPAANGKTWSQVRHLLAQARPEGVAYRRENYWPGAQPVSPVWCAAVDRCLAMEDADRFSRFEDLLAYVDGEPLSDTAPSEPVPLTAVRRPSAALSHDSAALPPPPPKPEPPAASPVLRPIPKSTPRVSLPAGSKEDRGKRKPGTSPPAPPARLSVKTEVQMELPLPESRAERERQQQPARAQERKEKRSQPPEADVSTKPSLREHAAKTRTTRRLGPAAMPSAEVASSAELPALRTPKPPARREEPPSPLPPELALYISDDDGEELAEGSRNHSSAIVAEARADVFQLLRSPLILLAVLALLGANAFLLWLNVNLAQQESQLSEPKANHTSETTELPLLHVGTDDPQPVE